MHEMLARIFYYTGIVADDWEDEQIITAHARIMFCLIERDEAKVA